VGGGPGPPATATAVLFGAYDQISTANSLLTVPEAAWELSLGVYLLVKGFKPSPILLEDVEMEDGPLAAALAGP
jgi:hypothetical protein